MPPLNLLIKPASGCCNMRCKYCFYTDEARNRETALLGKMSQATMRTLIDKALAYADRDCTFAFQGGEPSLAGLDFFQSFTGYAASRAAPQKVRLHYAFQTNGYALDDSWAKWFAENHVLVGISLDGPKEIHDRYRVDMAGKGTYHRVTASIRLLEKHHVDYNILTVITAANARRAKQLHEFFKKNNFRYQQYIECLDPIGEIPGGQEYSLTPERYAAFLKGLFDAWYLDMKAGRYVYNRYFENLMMLLSGRGAESCNLRGVCGVQWVVEADGSVYPCDFYALDEWQLGTVQENSFAEMDQRREELGFIQWPQQVPEECRTCRWYALCRNGCRRNREPVTQDTTGKNYFCSAYQNFFAYAFPRLQEIYLRYYCQR